ncbi:MAG: TRAP transporter substrate-binding protein DctP, partial [Pseudomonadota bacterium]
MDRWYRRYAADEMPDVHYCLSFAHEPGVLHTKSKIETLSDLRGTRVRPANSTVSRFLTSFGAIPINLAAGETRDALDKGVADAITFPWATVLNFGLDKSLKYHLDVPLYTSTTAILMNKRRYEGLSDNVRAAVDAMCTPSAARKIGAGWAAKEKAGKPELSARPGHLVYDLAPSELQKWRAGVRPLEHAWYERVARRGVDGPKALANLRAELRKVGAAYDASAPQLKKE